MGTGEIAEQKNQLQVTRATYPIILNGKYVAVR
jgi:hypothetical protein